jgi:hypothetical protein
MGENIFTHRFSMVKIFSLHGYVGGISRTQTHVHMLWTWGDLA